MSFFSSVNATDRLIFTKHLATMIKAGIPVAEGLDLIAQQTNSGSLRKVIEEVLADVRNGDSLADALAKYDKVFPPLFISLVSIGEESGTLEESLKFLASQLEKDLQLSKKIKGALLYPGLVVAATTIMGGMISFFILPQLVDFFGAFEIELPVSTRILLFVATSIKNYGLLILLGIVALLSGFYGFIHLPAVAVKWDGFKLKLPLLGKLISYGHFARFSRNLGVLLQSGVSATRSLEVVSQSLDNKKLQQDLQIVRKKLEKGGSIGEALDSKKMSFSPLIAKMAVVGEQTGNLDEMMLYLGDFYEEEIDSISKNLTTILEPLLLLVIGLVVGFVALAIISPIYELTGSIRR